MPLGPESLRQLEFLMGTGVDALGGLEEQRAMSPGERRAKRAMSIVSVTKKIP